MTKRDELIALAELCEQATEWNPATDRRISKTVFGDGPILPREFTRSLDAAMTLAEPFGGQLTFFRDGTAKAYLWQPYPLAVEAKAATPALALAAASLRALANQETE